MIQRASSSVVSAADPLFRNESPTVSTASTDAEMIVGYPPLGGKNGILKQCSIKTDTIRTDRTGTVIVTGSKSHHICFADEVQDSPRPIARVHHVESFKSQNFANIAGQPGCVCTIS
jgi:hypothetical protein